jgi:hypothetical protein
MSTVPVTDRKSYMPLAVDQRPVEGETLIGERASAGGLPRIAEPGSIERNLNPLLRVAVYGLQYTNSGDLAVFKKASTQKLNATTERFELVLARPSLADAPTWARRRCSGINRLLGRP